MKTLYITDLDGTFLNSNGEISEKSKEIVSKIINHGAAFTVATARTFATVTKMFADTDMKLPFVLMNGVMLYNPISKEIMSYHSIDKNAVEKVFEIYKKHNIFPLVYRCINNCLEIEYFSKDNPNQMKYVGNRTKVTGKKFVFTSDFTFKGKTEIIYIVTLDKYETILPLYEDLRIVDGISCAFYRDNYTNCYFLEIFAENVSKASALLEVKKIISADKVIAFGDNLNDLEMFSVADESYAVENACDELKNKATGVIGTNDNDSVTQFILEHFLENNK